jgi:multimeric flavodoxin WrbA
MKAILLNGIPAFDDASDRIRGALIDNLKSSGYEIEEVILREKTIGNCAGDFFCWIKSPGVCNVKDDNLDIARAFMNSDLAVYLSPVTFGGYSSTIKKFIDHQIQNISPYFAVVKGETHHQKRYEKYPDVMVIGYNAKADAPLENVFKHLAYRNSINFYAKYSLCEVLNFDQTDQQIDEIFRKCLKQFKTGNFPKSQPKLDEEEELFNPIKINRAVLLVGSPRTHKSTSNSLGDYLYNELGENNIHTETFYLHTLSNSTEKMAAMLKSIDSADLITLAFPLYVDSPPAPVISVLENIAAHKSELDPHPRIFTAIVNCGFPEAHHNSTAQAICKLFAVQAGFLWGGSLSLGGGGMVDGGSIAELGGRVTFIKNALDLAGAALVRGEAIPLQAKSLMSKSVIPAWLYRFMGSLGWKSMAKKFQVQNKLRQKPYEISPVQEGR